VKVKSKDYTFSSIGCTLGDHVVEIQIKTLREPSNDVKTLSKDKVSYGHGTVVEKEEGR
jgi:hypothetical protein